MVSVDLPARDGDRHEQFPTGRRETGFLLPPSVEEWLPERHLARFVVEVIEQLDLSAFVKAYRGSGSASYHPSMLLGLLVYGYATGVFSSRKLERATYDSVAFRFIAVNDHPDHDTIAAFRRRFLDRIEGLFVEVLLLAREAGVLKLGTVALDGTKVHANASRHSALSWKHACELEARLKAEVAELMALAEAADGADVPDEMSVPEELARREDRLARIAEAKAVIEARARERLERERAEYEAKLEARAEKAEKTGRKPGGRPPEPPVAGPGPKDQVNLTDADSRIMPVAGGGFEQAYNAQALVAVDSLLVVTNDVVQAPNDKRQIEPALEALARLPEGAGRARDPAGGQRLLQRGQRERLRRGRDRAVDHARPGTPSSLLEGPLRRRAAAPGEPDAAGSDDTSTGDARRPATLRPAQANAGTGVRHHQIGHGLPPVLAMRPGQGHGRMEPGDPGLEHKENVHLAIRLSRRPDSVPREKE